MAETEQEEEKRLLEELKGKNVAHYSVLLAAWIQTKMEHDKTLVTVSIGGIGYLITVLSFVGVQSPWEIGLFLGGFGGFLATVIAALVIYKHNAQHIENELRGSVESKPKPTLEQLDRVILWAFSLAVVCAILIGANVGWRKYMANTNEKAAKPEKHTIQEGFTGIERLRPSKDEHFHSLQGVEKLKPDSVVVKPSAQERPSGTTGAAAKSTGQSATDTSEKK